MTQAPIIAVIHFSMHRYAYAINSPDFTLFKNVTPDGKHFSPAVLLNPDRSLNALGTKAIKTYSNLHEPKKYFYTENFMVCLNDCANIDSDAILQFSDGQSINAMQVFSLILKHIKNECLKNISLFGSGDCKIFWGITVPSIKIDQVKDFMTDAASSAGILREDLHVFLEMEALPMSWRQMNPVSHVGPAHLSPSIINKYMLANLEGHRFEVCVHEITENQKIHELFQASTVLSQSENHNLATSELYTFLKECITHHPEVKTLMLAASHIKAIFQDKSCDEKCDELTALRKKLDNEFPELNVIIPKQPSKTMLDGSLTNRTVASYITEKTLDFTFGLDMLEKSEPQTNRLIVTENGEDWCDVIIEQFITKGHKVLIGKVFTFEGTEMTSDTDKKKIKFSPVWRYKQGQCCDIVGYVKRGPPSEGWPSLCHIRQEVCVKHSGFEVKYINLTTEQENDTFVGFHDSRVTA